MLRAYSRGIVDAINACREVSTFIPALAYTFAHNPAEVEVAHESRAAGESKYSLYRLIRLNFDLVTGFSVVPLQIFSLFGILIAIGSVLVYLVGDDRAHRSPARATAARSFWDRDILQFFLIGIVLFGLGLVGEYVGRIYQQVRERPRWLVQAVLERNNPGKPSGRLRLRGHRSSRPRRPPRRRRRGAARRHPQGRPERERAGTRACSISRGSKVFEFSPIRAIEALDIALSPISSSRSTTAACCRCRCCERARLGAFNMHGSLLPKFRGRAPLNWAILKGETETGVTLHEMVEKPDAGRIVDQQAVPIGPDETAVEVFRKMTDAAEPVLKRSLPGILAGQPRSANPRPRRTAATTAAAGPRTAASTGRRARRRSTTWCAPWRRPSRAPSPTA